jgi:hypothetical protein
MPGFPIGVEQFVTADRFNSIRRAGDQMIDGVGVTLAPNRMRVWLQGKALGERVDFDTALIVEFAFTQHQTPPPSSQSAGNRIRWKKKY